MLVWLSAYVYKLKPLQPNIRPAEYSAEHTKRRQILLQAGCSRRFPIVDTTENELEWPSPGFLLTHFEQVIDKGGGGGGADM